MGEALITRGGVGGVGNWIIPYSFNTIGEDGLITKNIPVNTTVFDYVATAYGKTDKFCLICEVTSSATDYEEPVLVVCFTKHNEKVTGSFILYENGVPTEYTLTLWLELEYGVSTGSYDGTRFYISLDCANPVNDTLDLTFTFSGGWED